MSRVFSITIMVSAMRMLSAATITISAMTMKVTTCSSLSARKSSRFCSIQLVVMKPLPAACSISCADLGGAVEVVDFEADHGEQVGLAEEALRVGEAHEAHGCVVLVEAGVEDAGDAEALEFGRQAEAGSARPAGW